MGAAVTVLAATGPVPVEDWALGMMRAQWDSGATLRLEPIMDETGMTRREVEAVRDWALSGKKGDPPWVRNRPRPRPAGALVPVADGTQPVDAPEPGNSPETPGAGAAPSSSEPATPQHDAAPAPGPLSESVDPSVLHVARGAALDRWRQAAGHPNPRIAELHEQVLALIAVIEDALDAEDELGLLRAEESALLAQLAQVRARMFEVAPPQADSAPPAAHTCDPCDRPFASEHALRIHRARAHKDSR